MPDFGERRVGVDLLVEGAGFFRGGELQLRHVRVRHDHLRGRFEIGFPPVWSP